MLFNSYDFLVFLVVVFGIFWVFGIYWGVLARSIRAQNVFLIVASYIFYGWWDWRFLILIAISSLADFVLGILISTSESQRARKQLVCLSLLINLGILGFFKYYDFFIDSFVDSFGHLGMDLHVSTLRIILPVGISFYTFQTLSYTIDVYRRRMTATKDPVAFFAFVSFFPQLVAGPIERAVHLLPQFGRARVFNGDDARDGVKQIMWGLFKKIAVADTAARVVDAIFLNQADLSGSTLTIGAVFFAFQIYGDFSGYSDIAIGTAKLFGFDLMQNFATPYFSRNIGEFWRRWHISLSTWFRDYVYISLGGNRVSKLKRFRNIIVTFTLSGLWHGASWNFVIWGFLHGLYYLPIMLFGLKQHSRHDVVAHGRFLPSIKEFAQIVLTFGLTLIAWVFFRAENLPSAISYLGEMFSTTVINNPWTELVRIRAQVDTRYGALCIALLLGVDWLQRSKRHGLELGSNVPVWRRYLIYFCFLTLLILLRSTGENLEFIYFQF